MPEGDTVYALARRLDTALRNRVLTHGELRVPAHATADLAGLTVLENFTHGKHLLTRLSSDLTLHTHLLMSGSWTVSNTGRWLPNAVMLDVRVVLRTDGPAAYGVKIPIVELLRTWDESDVIGHLGPDPLRDDWDIAEGTRRIREDPDRPLAAALARPAVRRRVRKPVGQRTMFSARPQPLDPGGGGRRQGAARTRRPGASSFGHRSGSNAGHDRHAPQR